MRENAAPDTRRITHHASRITLFMSDRLAQLRADFDRELAAGQIDRRGAGDGDLVPTLLCPASEAALHPRFDDGDLAGGLLLQRLERVLRLQLDEALLPRQMYLRRGP